MTIKEKAAAPGQAKAAINENSSPNNTTLSGIAGWLNLAANIKDSRVNRKPKRGWKRRQRGLIDTQLLGFLVFLAVTMALIYGGAL